MHSWNWIGNLILKLVCFLQLFDLSTPSVVLLHLKKMARANVVRFPNSLAFGSELGLQYLYRRGIFLCSPVALPILAEHGQMDAYWVREHLRKLQPQSHFCSLTGLGSSTPFLSSASLQLLLETDISLLLSWICHFQLSVFLTGSTFAFVSSEKRLFKSVFLLTVWLDL